MKIKIDSDVFNIVNRLKEIDNGYFVMYNLNTKKFEIHNDKNRSTYCLTIPYTQLDSRALNIVNKTLIKNYDKIIKELDENNEKIQKKELEKSKEINDYKIREILKYTNSSSKDIDKAFTNAWI